MKIRILITGCAGYIGSHVLLYALKRGYQVIAIDSLERGFYQAIEKVEKLAGKKVAFFKADIRNKPQIYEILKENPVDVILHLAAYKSVPESQQKPEMYYENNVNASKNLLDCMVELGIPRIFFSSTAAVYGNNPNPPFTEETPIEPISVYAKTKAALEDIVRNYVKENKIQAIAFRYFNVIGADESGQIGESPKYTTNLLPIVMQTLIGRREYVELFGNNFNTRDGTQERDYIHVNDIAEAHFKALEYDLSKISNLEIFNLSTGKSTSCLEIFQLAEKITGRKLNYKVTLPRPGDPQITYASNKKATELLKWTPTRSLEDSIRSHWIWCTNYPEGYDY